jgi:hypothetical protein
MESIKTLLQAGKIKEALKKFKALPDDQQEDFFRESVPTLFPPSFMVVLSRKLKPGFVYKDFDEAHQPPLSEGQKVTGYFHYPTYVISGENKDDPRDILTIGMMWIPENKFNQELERVTESELRRHDRIAKVADKVGETRIYKTKKVDKFGS